MTNPDTAGIGETAPAPRRRRRILLAAPLAIAALLGTAYWIGRPAPPAPLAPVALAVPTQINSGSVLVAHAHGLFRKAGVEVAPRPFLLGKDALRAVLDGAADLAVVADTPFVFAALGGADIAIVAGISQARRSLAIVARGDRGIARIDDLRGKSIGVTSGTNFTYFFDSMLQVNGVASGAVRQIDLKVDDGIAALQSGAIDAVVVFQPFLARLDLAMGGRIKVFHGEDIYAFRFLLVGKPAYIDAHPREVRRVLRALLDANQLMHDEPASARLTVGRAVGVDDAIMAKLFDPEDYVLTLDQAMLLTLDDQSRWAMRKGLAPAGPIPNFLNYMKYRDLEAVMPSAVKIVR